MLFESKSKSHKDIIYKLGPKTEPSGTPNKVSSQELYDVFIFALCVLFDKQLYISLDLTNLSQTHGMQPILLQI